MGQPADQHPVHLTHMTKKKNSQQMVSRERDIILLAGQQKMQLLQQLQLL